MQSFYEVNVSLNGMHFFATAPRSGVSRENAKFIAQELTRRFPEAEGYKVTVTKWDACGRDVNFAA